jgi:hypothetical protein
MCVAGMLEQISGFGKNNICHYEQSEAIAGVLEKRLAFHNIEMTVAQ